MLPPHLLPWQQGGVDYLLAVGDLPPELSLCRSPAAPSPGSTPQPMPKNAPRRAPEERAAAAPASSFAARRAAAAATRPEAPPRRSAPPAETASVAPPQHLLPPDHWPRLWQERLAATHPAPVLWTYWALGEDLYGSPDPARRALLRRLLADLAHPTGTHCFWPAALPPSRGQHDLEANTEVFWSGVDLLKARALVVLGSPAVAALKLPPRLQPFHQTRHNGRLVIVLRDPDILAREAHHYDAVREFLRQALAPFGRR